MTKWLYFHFSLSCIGEGNGNPLQCSCLENPRDRGAWWLPSMGSHRVGHDWSDLAAAAGLWAVSKKYLPTRNFLGEVNRKILKTEQAFKKSIWINKLKKLHVKMSTLLNMREMQIKTSRTSQNAIDGNSTNNKCWRGCRAKGTLLQWCCEWKLRAATVEDTGQVP